MFAGLVGMQALFFFCAGYWLGRCVLEFCILCKILAGCCRVGV